MYSYYIYICLSKHEKRLSSNETMSVSVDDMNDKIKIISG